MEPKKLSVNKYLGSYVDTAFVISLAASTLTEEVSEFDDFDAGRLDQALQQLRWISGKQEHIAENILPSLDDCSDPNLLTIISLSERIQMQIQGLELLLTKIALSSNPAYSPRIDAKFYNLSVSLQTFYETLKMIRSNFLKRI